ncbi:hypothetical protein ACIBSV_00935 [Embleya sp. NPDC050154]|uniref:alpha-L-rhamnosidase-related protein n=1 Tax=Embleya sp. NPDC050154 TaxID=3363988 RepID=UPI00379B9689
MIAKTDFPPGRWRARWIWAEPRDDRPPGRHAVALRAELHLDAVPERVPTRVVALSGYALSVNGVEVARGPVRANPRVRPYDDLDLAGRLRPGANVVTALAWVYDGPNPWWLPPSPFANDLVHGAFVLEARLGPDTWFVTDERWQAHLLDGWTATAGGGTVSGRGRELLDARALPADWQLPDHDPGWPAAVLRRAMTTGEPGRPEPPSYPGGPFGGRPITWPQPRETILTPGAGGGYTAAQVLSGTLVVDAHGPTGAEVVLHTAEFLDPSGRPAPGEHDASLAVTADGGRRVLESLDSYGLRGVLVEAPDDVTVHRVAVRERTYPVTGGAWFTCSDPRLEQIWRVGRRTVTLCSADAYVDCPTREQRAWTGDAVVHQLVDLTTNADWRLARWHPRLAASPRSDGMLPMAVAGDAEWADFTVIPDWALHWVHSVWNLYRYVGDREEIAELLPVAERVLRWFVPFLDDTGLPTDVFGWVIIDWSAVHTEGVSAALCGLWGRGLLEFAELADWLGDRGRADWARAAHARLVAGFERLWDPERERYADSIADGERRPMASQHGQAAAIVGGLVPAERIERLVRVLTAEDDLVHAAFSAPDGPADPGSDTEVGGAHLRAGPPKPWWDTGRQVVRAQPFFRYVVHDALARAGRADLIAGLCLDWVALLARSDTSWSETWYGGTVSHGWSSTPTRDLMTRVLGVEPAEPGFAVARIDPELGYLTRAAGAVPCPAGRIEVVVTPSLLTVDSPVPFVHAGRRRPAGRHTIHRADPPAP